jgi:hypothetical protein
VQHIAHIHVIASENVMGVHFAIDRDARLVAYAVEGHVTADQARAFIAGILVHPDYEPGFNFLGDRREVEWEPDSAHVVAVALEVEARKAWLAPCRWAVLVSSDVGYGMARMWGLLTIGTGVSIRPFRMVEKAVEWLGLPADYSPPLFAHAS